MVLDDESASCSATSGNEAFILCIAATHDGLVLQ